MSLSYRNQSIDLQSKSMNWFLYERSLRHERLNEESYSHLFFNTNTIKNISTKFHGFSFKTFADTAKYCYFLRFYEGDRNMFVHKSEGIFLNIFAKACPYGLKTSRNIDIKYIFSFKVRFHVFDTFYTSSKCL